MSSSHRTNILAKTKESHVVLKSKAPDAQPTVTYALQQQALRIAHAMQTTLDIYHLLQRFNRELKDIVPFHSFEYNNEESKHHYLDGTIHKHTVSYAFNVEQQALGDLTLTRNEAFSEQEILLIENALSQLMLPLRNSLSYHDALVSSLTDPLTQLGNRQAYDCAIKKEFEFCKRHQINLSLLICDLDKFKKINDTYGHKAGDAVLIATASIMASACRDSDIVFRYGGEEFAIILKNCDQHGAKALADRIREALTAHTVQFHDQLIKVSTSIGLAHLQSQDSPDSLFERADSALYEAKTQGGNRAVFKA